MYDLISLDRLPYLREAPRDFAGDAETVFTEIVWKHITPEQE